MNKRMTILAACAVLFAGALALGAGNKAVRLTQAQQDDSTQLSQRGSGTLQGVVQGYSKEKDKDYLTIKVPLERNAQILRDGRPAKPQDIHRGDDVRAAYDPGTGALIHVEAESKQMQKQMGK